MSRTIYWFVVEYRVDPVPNDDSTIPEMYDINNDKQLEIFSKATGYTGNGFKNLVHEDLVEFMEKRMFENKFMGFEVLKNIGGRR